MLDLAELIEIMLENYETFICEFIILVFLKKQKNSNQTKRLMCFRAMYPPICILINISIYFSHLIKLHSIQ